MLRAGNLNADARSTRARKRPPKIGATLDPGNPANRGSEVGTEAPIGEVRCAEDAQGLYLFS
jgi:hypothetical protein